MKNRLVKAFNEVYFRDVKGKSKALTKDYKINDINKKSVECAQNINALNLLSDLLKLESTDKINSPLSETALDILWDLSEAKVIFKKSYSTFPEEVKILCGHLSYLSNESYFVGGCVRDVLISKEPKDFDFVTSTPYDTLVKYFTNEGYTVKEKGKQFLVLIISKNEHQFEIANFRKDSTYTDGRRPDSVDIGTIEEDALRRDLSVNSCYVNTKTFTVKDPTGQGIDDINTKTLRFVGNPKDRIKEDKLRVFRFYRFISKGFTPDKRSLQACREHFSEATKTVAPERIRAEIEKIVGL